MTLPKFVLQQFFDITCGSANATWLQALNKQRIVRIDGTTIVFSGTTRDEEIGALVTVTSTEIDGVNQHHEVVCNMARGKYFDMPIQCNRVVAVIDNMHVHIQGYCGNKWRHANNGMFGACESTRHPYNPKNGDPVVASLTAVLRGSNNHLSPVNRIIHVSGNAYLKTANNTIMGDMSYYPEGDEDGIMFAFKTRRTRIDFNLDGRGRLHSQDKHTPAISRYDYQVDADGHILPESQWHCAGAIYAWHGQAMPSTEVARQVDRVLKGLPQPLYEEVRDHYVVVDGEQRKHTHVTTW